MVGRGGRRPARARWRSSGCPRRRPSRSAARAMSTWTCASSQGTNSPFIQILSTAGLRMVPPCLSLRDRRGQARHDALCISCVVQGFAWAARSRVRAPSASARSTADSSAAASGRPSVSAQHERDREDRRAADWPCPGPAMSGAEPWIGSNSRGRRPPSEAMGSMPMRAGDHRRLVGEDVAEHVLGDDTSNCYGSRISCMATLSTSTVLELRLVNARRHVPDDLAPQARALEHVRLVDARHLAAATSAKRQANRRSARSPRS